MSNILVPVDGSESAKRAVKAAIEAVKLINGAKLHLLTVRPPILSGNVTRFISAEALNDYYQDEGRKALESAKELLDNAGLAYEEKIEIGQAAVCIADYVKEHQINQIIMGTRGLGSVTGLVLGSVATKVLSLVDVPVTLVR